MLYVMEAETGVKQLQVKNHQVALDSVLGG